MKVQVWKKFVMIFLAVVALGCSKDSEVKTRSFMMGFTPFPYEISLDAVNTVYAHLDKDADIINHHFDNGVPWVEALNGQPFHQQIIDDWNFRKGKTSLNHKVYLSVGPLNFTRNGLAAYRGESDNMALPSPWDTYRFNQPEVKTAYLNYCKRSIDFFEPDYFNMGIETNLLYALDPSSWNDFLEFHQYIYTQLKGSYPDLPVFSSLVGAQLLPGFIDGNDHVQQRLAAKQVLEFSDLYGISFYPFMSKFLGNPFPDNAWDELFEVSDKPVAIAETGYPAQTFSMDTGNGVVTIESDQAKQQKYTQDLLAASERRKALFVINFVIRDYDQLWQQIGSPNDINIAWRDSGLYDEHGVGRAALTTWRDFLARKYAP
jgi:hypothetical protein